MIIIFILGVVFRECILVIFSFILRVCFLTEIIGGVCCSMNIIIWRRCLGFILWWKAKEFHCCNEAWKRKLPKKQTAVIQDWMCESNTSTVHACVKYLYSVKMLTSNIANLGRYRPLAWLKLSVFTHPMIFVKRRARYTQFWSEGATKNQQEQQS